MTLESKLKENTIEALRKELDDALELIDSIGSHCGHPDSAEACRIILKKIKAFKDRGSE